MTPISDSSWWTLAPEEGDPMHRGCEGLAARLGVMLVLSLSIAFGANEVMAVPIAQWRALLG